MGDFAKKIAKKLIKKGKKALVNTAKGTISDAVRDGSKDKAIAGGAKFPVSKHGGRKARPEINVSKKIELKGDRKKKKANKKIAKWEKERKSRSSAGSKQAEFLALDKKIKSKK